MGAKVVTLSTGVQLKVRQVSPFLLLEVYKRFPEPPVPMVRIEGKGRDEPNPNDPAYIKALEELEQKRGEATIDTLVMFGTEVASIPEGFSQPTDADWLEALDAIGIEVDPNKVKKRYLAWVKWMAAPTGEDVAMLNARVVAANGTPESEVAAAAQQFRGDEG